MRRTGRRSRSLEFPSSGEDSFVAVVVTKLTGALLFILLVSLVILALVPKAGPTPASGEAAALPLEIQTPAALPEAVAGRPYQIALAVRGARGDVAWSLASELPEGLSFDPAAGLIQGTPARASARPLDVAVSARDGARSAAASLSLTVLEPGSAAPRSPAVWKPVLPVIAWRSWAEHGVGFLLIALVAWLGLGTVDRLERTQADPESPRKRFWIYRAAVGLTGLAAAVGLAAWLAFPGKFPHS